MGLDDIERLLRTDDRTLSPVERSGLIALLRGAGHERALALATALNGSAVTADSLTDAHAERLLAALAAEYGDPDVERVRAGLSRGQVDLLGSSLTEIAVDSDGPRRTLAEQLRATVITRTR